MEYIPTADAIEEYLDANAERRRLSDLFHRMARADTPKLKTRASTRLADKENQLIADVCWAVAQRELPLVVLASNAVLLPQPYLSSSKLRDALMGGLASRFNLAPGDLAWSDARLAFPIEPWREWLKIRAKSANSSNTSSEKRVSEGTTAPRPKGHGRRQMEDNEHIARYLCERKRNARLSVREFVLNHDKEIAGAGIDAKVRRLQQKIRAKDLA